MPSKVTSVGNPEAQQRFIKAHEAFLDEFPALQALLLQAFRLAENKCYREQSHAEQPAQSDDEARKVVLHLERAMFDDFGELLVLAGNGLGFGAKKALRSVYERLVTAVFIARFPAEATAFLANADIEKGKVMQRAVDAVPQLVSRDFTPEEIQQIADRKKAGETKKKSEKCPKCRQPVTEEAWTRLKLDAMARKVDQGLLNLYGSCYLTPTLLSHATSFGLDLRFRQVEGADRETLEERYARASVWRGHYLMLWLLGHMDGYYKLRLKDRVDARCAAFSTIWPENSMDV